MNKMIYSFLSVLYFIEIRYKTCIHQYVHKMSREKYAEFFTLSVVRTVYKVKSICLSELYFIKGQY